MATRPNWTPPTIPTRKSGWDAAFIETIQHHVAAPFAYGASDCLLMAGDVCRAMTGVDPMRGLRHYRTEVGALRLLARLGFGDVEDALAAVFPRLAGAAQAMRGDAGVVVRLVDGQPVKSTVIVLDHRAFGKHALGPLTVPTLTLSAVFAIGAR